MTARQHKEWWDGLIALAVIVAASALILYSLSVTESVKACFQ